VAEGGAQAFYTGEIARAIVNVIQQTGGVMELEDLAAHTSTWEEPISVSYRGHRVWECPPNGQGLTALLALNILEGFDLAALPPLSVDRWHLLIEALRLAFADARWYVSDPTFNNIPLAGLLSQDYAAQRRALIDMKHAGNPQHGSPINTSGTVYCCVVDGDGNACSFINSNYMGFGTGLVPEGWGFTLQNRGHNFSLDASHPNALAPRKRPYHTIIPGLITHADGTLFGPFGVMGGFMQPQGHTHVVSAMLDDGLHPQAALDRLRFCIDAEETNNAPVLLEAGLPQELVEGLRAHGHNLQAEIGGLARANFGRGQIIRRTAEGVLWGGSDPRADGCAVGF
jgi:gamma-glutamyltranspeptidase/glutathione hydrolase